MDGTPVDLLLEVDVHHTYLLILAWVNFHDLCHGPCSLKCFGVFQQDDVSNLDVWPVLPPFCSLLKALEIFGLPSLL